MALVRNFLASTSNPGQIVLNWDQPLDFNNTTDEVIITKTITHFPVELFNEQFPNRATDSRPIEIYRGKSIVGLDTNDIFVIGNTIFDSGASFPTTPDLTGRLLRDSNSSVFRITANDSTSITLTGTPANGKYVVLPDFTQVERGQENFEVDLRTTAGLGFISNLVIFQENSLRIKQFIPGELANLIFRDGLGNKFIIKTNTVDTIYFYEDSSIPIIEIGMAILNKFSNSNPLPYIDNFRTELEADIRKGSRLLDNRFYYYTAFTKPENTNVAQAQYGTIDSGNPTQSFAINVKDRQFGDLLYNLWPSLDRELDETGDLQDLMSIFGHQLNELHALIDTYRLQDADNVLVTALLPLSEQTGLPSVGFSIGADTLRRIANEMIGCWKLKGSKEGIALFIRMITTWDITNGVADYSGAITDFLPNVSALRFLDPNLGSLNVRLTSTDPFVAGGRFAMSLPGIVIPGFFTFREFVIDIPNVALYVGATEGFTVGSGFTTITDTNNNYGLDDSLVGNFLIPNTEEVNDIFEIIGNTNNTITVRGVINNRTPGGTYAVLSPLNTSRFIILNNLMPSYVPYGTKSGYRFVITL